MCVETPQQPVAGEECEYCDRDQQAQCLEHVKLQPKNKEEHQDATEAQVETDCAGCQGQVGHVNAQFSPENEKQHQRGDAQSSEDVGHNARWTLVGNAELVYNLRQRTRCSLRLNFCNKVI